MQTSILAVIFTACAVANWAQPNGSAPAGFAEARRLYYAGIDGDSDAAKRSAALFEGLRKAHPDVPLVLAYFGSTRLLESARTLALWRKGKLAKEGLTALDRAVQMAPNALEVRFIRAMSTFHLPGFFGRGDQSRADFAKLAGESEAAVHAGTFDSRLAAAALYHHGVFLERAKDEAGARRAWQAAARVDPESKAGRDAAKRLD